MFTLKKVSTDGEIKEVEFLADEIWREHYAEILSIEQIDYMLDKFQSFSAIKKAIEQDGYEYYLVQTPGGEYLGYFGIVPTDGGKLFLSKLYLAEKIRGKGAGKLCLEKCKEIAREKKLGIIYLTVNRENPSFGFYKKVGFKTVREEKTDIGCGFVMDDYIMELTL